MPRKAPLSLFRNLTLSITLGALAVVVVLFGVSEFVLQHSQRQEMSKMVDTDLAGLADIYISGGDAELQKRIHDRLELEDVSGDLQIWYLVSDDHGVARYGNLQRWPEISAENSQAGYIELGNGQRAFARATQLGPDVKLLVARANNAYTMLQWQMRLAYLIAAVVIISLAWLLTSRATARIRRRTQELGQALAALGRGELDTPLPEGERPDELAQLARHGNRMREKLSLLLTSHRDLSDQLAHEIRTPLLHLDSKLLRAISGDCDPETQRMLGQSRADIRSVVTLLDSLLDIAASQTRKGDVARLPPVNLSDLASKMVDLYSESAQDLGIEFTHDIADNITLKGDEMGLQRLISNLLDNAFKYVGEAGHVSLRLSSGPVLEICDNGPGVPEQHREAIFERFHRGASGDDKGHGLGLALCRAVAERHNLVISCENGSLAYNGKGACFVVRPGEIG